MLNIKASDLRMADKNGNVFYLMDAGADKVSGHMPIENARALIRGATSIEKVGDTGTIKVDGKYYFYTNKMMKRRAKNV